MIVKLFPLLLMLAFVFGSMQFSAWRMSRQLKQGSEPLKDRRLERYAKKLAKGAGLAPESVEVRVLQTPMLNGLAAPDGLIYLTQGFVDQYRQGRFDAEELASVIAHELGHVDMGHAQRRMREATGINATATVIVMAFARLIPIIGIWIGQAVAGILARLVGARNSRSDEFEADQFAAALLLQTGIGVDAQTSLLAKLDQDFTGAQAPSWFMSHPQAKDRIAAINAFAQRWTMIE